MDVRTRVARSGCVVEWFCSSVSKWRNSCVCLWKRRAPYASKHAASSWKTRSMVERDTDKEEPRSRPSNEQGELERSPLNYRSDHDNPTVNCKQQQQDNDEDNDDDTRQWCLAASFGSISFQRVCCLISGCWFVVSPTRRHCVTSSTIFLAIALAIACFNDWWGVGEDD